MAPIRVLIVDDTVIVRKLVSDVLEADPEITVAATAPNGRVALQKVPMVAPDVVVLDVEMPVMGGLETLRVLRDEHPHLPVIMFSSLTERGASTTLDALALGARDYVAKPTNTSGILEAREQVREQLVPKVKALGRRRTPSATPPAAPPVRAASGRAARVDAVVVGVSTGGPNALVEVLPALPADFPVPVLVVQHMPPLFTKSLADRLDRASALAVREAADGDVPTPGTVWIAPGGLHLDVVREGGAVRLRTHEGPPENNCRPAVDVLFRSAAAVWGRNALGVVLTGMGHDGRVGAEHLTRAGARVVAQDEATSVVWGMPGAVVRAGLADAVVPLDRVAAEVEDRVARRPALAGTG
ncbi:chemotaxis response regulator protein-glutamate methylesterase [Rubrivirga sp. S365]|uniref:protein-glutamate methylesterase/protein-glutamine glutaminase n=1 Tax=Rubrivirga sp. S365 TaxID=3076080 RepID=UPI0028C69BC4|nr:chemotaxis response regulator protein-glutamate methylesterase [Rubrivirga sp. S365]MDT7856050.1 chemotaxis response regulator protein-glutamate methylesterase [Rubrivirga sp. S365]